jgi:hypothetical protein
MITLQEDTMTEKKTAERKTRSMIVPVPDKLAEEIRAVAADLGLPVGTVREIAVRTAVDALNITTGQVKVAVAKHFARMADGKAQAPDA